MNRDYREEAYCWWDDANEEEVARIASRFGLKPAEIDDLGLSELPQNIQTHLIIEASFDRLGV